MNPEQVLTRKVRLHLTGYEIHYYYIIGYARAVALDVENDIMSMEDGVYDLARLIEEYVEEVTLENEHNTLALDVLSSALSYVDWRELSQEFLVDAKETLDN